MGGTGRTGRTGTLGARAASPVEEAGPGPGLPAGLELAAAYLLAGSALAVLVLVLLGWQRLAHPWLLVGDTVVSSAVGAGVLAAHRRGTRVPRPVQYAIALLGVALISLTSLAIGGTEGAVFACSYAFALAIAAMHYPLRHVLTLLGVVGAMYAAVVAVRGDSFTQWVLVVGVAAASGLLAGRYHRHVRRLTARLQHLESWRSVLMSSLAHDLRSPLGMADSTLQLLLTRSDDLTAAQRHELLSAARRHQQRALALTRDLLDHERVHAGALELELRATRLADEVTAACGHVPVAVHVDIDPGIVVEADPGRLHQVVVNLVSNAAKHGRGPIEVGARREGAMARCWVRDHGPGLAPAQREALFTRFGTGEASDSVGLGLWIVERLVRAHGGEVSYDDARPGARFTWTLRAAQPAQPTHPAGDAA